MSSDRTPHSVDEAMKLAEKRYFQAGKKTKAKKGICPICFKNLNNGKILRRIRACQHFFHKDCMHEWFQNNKCCPVCRTVLYENFIPLEIYRKDLLRKTTSKKKEEALAVRSKIRTALKAAKEAVRNAGAAADELLELNEPDSSTSYFASESKEVSESVQTVASSSGSYISSGITDYLSSYSSSSDNRGKTDISKPIRKPWERRGRKRKRRKVSRRSGPLEQPEPKNSSSHSPLSSESEDEVKKPYKLFKM